MNGPNRAPGDPKADLDGDNDCDLKDFAMFANWDGSGRTVPRTLWSERNGILSLSFAEDSAGEGHIVFAIDEDGDLEAKDDRQLYAIETIAGVWQAMYTNTRSEDEGRFRKLNPGGLAATGSASGKHPVTAIVLQGKQEWTSNPGQALLLISWTILRELS